MSYLHGVLHFLHTSVRGWAEATTVGDKVVDLATTTMVLLRRLVVVAALMCCLYLCSYGTP